MNLLLFEKPFESVRLEGADFRAQHLRNVLRVDVGDPVFIGFVGGLRARARVTTLEADGAVCLEVERSETVPPPLPLRLLFGLPRPHTAKRILFDAAGLGVAELHFVQAERSEPSYAQSKLWQADQWRERLRLGAEQAFTTHLPAVRIHNAMEEALEALSGVPCRAVLDNYEGESELGAFLTADAKGAAIAVGPEGGWSDEERGMFRANGWALVHMGPFVMRTEMAGAAAVAVAASRLGLSRNPTHTKL
ncbi:MAG: RsmE family RNA methyltransferase [Opitutales bacterium]